MIALVGNRRCVKRGIAEACFASSVLSADLTLCNLRSSGFCTTHPFLRFSIVKEVEESPLALFQAGLCGNKRKIDSSAFL